jgi:hypothetical protein
VSGPNLLDMLASQDELNTKLAADPDLAANMAEMGFIKRLPFQRDHNEQVTAAWAWTDYGRKEMMERLDAGAEFVMGKGVSKQ